MVKYDFDSDDMERKLIIRRLEKIKKSLIKRNKIKDIISSEKVEPYVINYADYLKQERLYVLKK